MASVSLPRYCVRDVRGQISLYEPTDQGIAAGRSSAGGRAGILGPAGCGPGCGILFVAGGTTGTGGIPGAVPGGGGSTRTVGAGW